MAAAPLTARQAAVALLVAQGYTDKQIAATLAIAEGTVKSHVHRIGEALEVDPQRNLRVQIATRLTSLAA